MPTVPRILNQCVALVALATLCSNTAGRAADERDVVRPEPSAQIARLIEQLGSPQFATREKAQSRIQSLGLDVFDALLDAQHHRDIEIARRARYLLRGMPVQWSRDTDSQEVRSFLRDYGQQGRDERRSRIESLAGLDNSRGVAALCRIMRYEADVILSKQAALRLMMHHEPVDQEDRQSIATLVVAAVGNSRRPAAVWLKAYADSLTAPEATLDQWDKITRDELEILVKTPDETQRSVVRDLLRWHVDFLRDLKRSDELHANITRIVELVEPDREELFDVVDWALERDAWFVPEMLANRFPAAYWQYELLIYRLAEAKRRDGDEAAANEAAKRALAMNPRQYDLHLTAARQLRYERQMFDWAEAEFRQLIETSGELTKVEIVARAMFADMLSDLQREREAAEILEPAVAIGEKDPAALASAYEFVYREAISPAGLRAKIDHYWGIHYGREGDVEKQKSYLQKALAVDTQNIDIVIALHGAADDDKAWRDEVDALLADHVQRIDRELKRLEGELAANTDRDTRSIINLDFAQKNNEYAWLVSNTARRLQKGSRL